MVDICGEDDFIVNDNTKKVAVEDVSYRFYKTTSANLKPGMPYKFLAGTSTGIVETATNDTGANIADGVVELDKKQIWDCTTGYGNGDTAPCIPFVENKGKILRNLFVLDPNAAVEKKTALGIGQSGFQVNVSDNFQSGAYVQTYKYRVDPTADYRSIGRVM